MKSSITRWTKHGAGVMLIQGLTCQQIILVLHICTESDHLKTMWNPSKFLRKCSFTDFLPKTWLFGGWKTSVYILFLNRLNRFKYTYLGTDFSIWSIGSKVMPVLVKTSRPTSELISKELNCQAQVQVPGQVQVRSQVRSKRSKD